MNLDGVTQMSATTGTTGTSTNTRETIVANAIREISHIATLPEVTLKIIQIVEDPKSTAQDLHKVVSHDPALCSRILKVVNSSFYGLPGQIGSINRAIVMLGLNAVKNIAIAASMSKLFRGGDLTPQFSAKNLWTHSVGVAAACKMLADTLKIGLSDEAFLAGLMHDVGVMVELQADRNKLIEVLQKVGCDSKGIPARSLLEVEDEVFGANHQDFGAALCEKWKFPKALAFVTGFHHNPMSLAHDSRTLTCIVHVADRLAAEAAGGYRLDLPALNYDPAVLDQLRLSQEKLADIRSNIATAIQSAPDFGA
jgi:HD-like signal output (HDOD) protein